MHCIENNTIYNVYNVLFYIAQVPLQVIPAWPNRWNRLDEALAQNAWAWSHESFLDPNIY